MHNKKTAIATTKPIRVWSEYNIARFSWFLFPPSNSPLANTPRSIETPPNEPGGAPGKINVVPSLMHPAPDQFCYDVLLGIVSMWREGHETDEAVTIKTSLRGIANAMGISGGKDNIDRIYQALLSLHYTHFQFLESWLIDQETASFSDKHFSFISLLEQNYVKKIRGENNRFTNEHLAINLPTQILKSLESSKACCVSLTQRRALRNTNSKLLYSHVDRIIAKTGQWTKNGDALLEWFLPHQPSLTSPKRKLDFINKLVGDLNGTVTSWGTLIHASIDESRTSVLPKLIFKTALAPLPSVAKFTKLKRNDETTMDEIGYVLGQFFKCTQPEVSENAGLDSIVKYGDLETVRITISNVREDLHDFSDIDNLRGFFVDRFKKMSVSRRTQNPFEK